MLICLAAAASSAGAEPRINIDAADFTPVLALAPGQTQTHIAAFRLDSRPVTNGQFVTFVRDHPQWRRDRVPSIFADEAYLSHWAAPDTLGPAADPNQPVTRVSWFAARAYCAAAGGRLPRWNEWELAAAADEHVADARANPSWRAQILDWYARPATDPLGPVAAGRPNLHGIYDLHGLIWEWVDDYGSLLVSSDSRDQGDPDKLEFCGAGSISAQDRENYPVLMRIAFLSALEGRSTARRLGFRCADDGKTALSTSTGVEEDQTLPGDSLYHLPLFLETADGSAIQLRSLRSAPLIVTMFYGRCNSVCPMLTSQLQALQRRLPPRTRTGIHILMVSLDPDNDNPNALSAFRQQHQLAGSQWIIARTTPDGVRVMAAALGIRYRQLADGSINHSTVIALADRDGVIRARTSGILATDTALVATANAMFLTKQRHSR